MSLPATSSVPYVKLLTMSIKVTWMTIVLKVFRYLELAAVTDLQGIDRGDTNQALPFYYY